MRDACGTSFWQEKFIEINLFALIKSSRRRFMMCGVMIIASANDILAVGIAVTAKASRFLMRRRWREPLSPLRLPSQTRWHFRRGLRSLRRRESLVLRRTVHHEFVLFEFHYSSISLLAERASNPIFRQWAARERATRSGERDGKTQMATARSDKSVNLWLFRLKRVA